VLEEMGEWIHNDSDDVVDNNLDEEGYFDGGQSTPSNDDSDGE
jgi:hypothetical protein